MGGVGNSISIPIQPVCDGPGVRETVLGAETRTRPLQAFRAQQHRIFPDLDR